VSRYITAHQANTINLHSATHFGSRWKIQDTRQIKKTENTETKHNPEKAKQRKTWH